MLKNTKEKKHLVETNERYVRNVKKNHLCKCCGKPLKLERWVWDSSVKDYVLVGEDGVRQMDKRLTDEHYEALEKQAFDRF